MKRRMGGWGGELKGFGLRRVHQLLHGRPRAPELNGKAGRKERVLKRFYGSMQKKSKQNSPLVLKPIQ